MRLIESNKKINEIYLYALMV